MSGSRILTYYEGQIANCFKFDYSNNNTSEVQVLRLKSNYIDWLEHDVVITARNFTTLLNLVDDSISTIKQCQSDIDTMKLDVLALTQQVDELKTKTNNLQLENEELRNACSAITESEIQRIKKQFEGHRDIQISDDVYTLKS